MTNFVFQVLVLRNYRILVRYSCLIFGASGDRLLYVPEAALVLLLFYTRCCSSALKETTINLRHFKFIIHVHPLIACYITCLVELISFKHIQKQNPVRCQGLCERCAGNWSKRVCCIVFSSVVKESEAATEILQGFTETGRRARCCLKSINLKTIVLSGWFLLYISRREGGWKGGGDFEILFSRGFI